MKKILYCLVLSILLLYILFCPKEAVAAASAGLILWYTRVLPTLLPFAILSYIFVATGLLNSFTRPLHRLIHRIIPVSAAGVYPLIAGFLFGFPLGSKITAQLVEQGSLDYREGNRLFSICNNISPIFISGFILTTSLKHPELQAITLAILYLPPLAYYALDTRLSLFRRNPPGNGSTGSPDIQKNTASRSQMNFKIIDAGIMSGFETLTKLGGYIILFAILGNLTGGLSMKNPYLQCLLTGITEITNGIACIAQTTLPFHEKYLLAVFLTAFGGLSGLAQTASMVKEAGFSMGVYLKTKIICSFASAALALLYLRFWF